MIRRCSPAARASWQAGNMMRGFTATSAEVVGMMRARSPQERQQPLDVVEFLRNTAIAALRGDDTGAREELALVLRRTAGILLAAENPADVRKAVRFLLSFDVLAARIALARNEIGVALAEVQADLDAVEGCLAGIDVGTAEEIRLLSGALRRSAGILQLVPEQLPEQLLFRLRGQNGPLLARLLRGADGYKAGTWLRPLTTPTENWQEVVRYLRGHAAAVCFDPAGRLLVVDSQRWLECLDLSGAEPWVPFRTGQGEPTGLACDGTFAAIPTRDGPIRIIDLATGQRAPLLPEGTGATLAVAFIRPGCLASGGTDGRLRLWDIASSTEIGQVDIGDVNVEALAPIGGDRLAVGTEPDLEARHTLQIWNLRTGQREAKFASHDWPVTALDIPAGSDLLLAAANGELSAWRLSDLSCIWRTERQHVTFHSLASESDYALAADSGGSLWVLGLRDGAEIRRLSPHSGVVPAIAVDAPRRRFVTVSHDQSILLWDMKALERQRPPGHQQAVRALALTASGEYLLSGSKDGRILRWDARTGTFEAELGRHEHWVSAIAALPDDRAVSASWDGTVRVWDVKNGKCVTVVKSGDDHLTCLACASSASRAVTASTDGVIRVWDLASGDQLALATAPDQDVLAVAVDDDHVWWMTEAGRLFSWDGHGDPVSSEVPADGRVTACRLGAPDGILIVGFGDGRLIKITADGKAATFGGAGCGPSAIACDAVGQVVLAAYGVPLLASDNTARLWTGPEYSSHPAVLVGDRPWTAAAVAGDGRRLYLGDASGDVHVIEPVLPAFTPRPRPRLRGPVPGDR
jgi:WD40 repeat protein